MPIKVPDEKIIAIGKLLCNPNKPLKERFRALFTLRNLGGDVAISAISECFSDPSALLKHELAYCLGQMQDKHAIPKLVEVLKDTSQEPMVRHEAGEALGAIGDTSILELLQEYSNDPVIEVAETCQLAVERLRWLQLKGKSEEKLEKNETFLSVDPAPAAAENDVEKLKGILTNESLPLFDRYRAMFSLRNINSPESAKALAAGFKGASTLFRHEIGFVLGQMSCESVVEDLAKVVADKSENEMVRHEAAEALGAIATEGAMKVLEEHLKDEAVVVRESCIVALDMCDYENSKEFQYADGLVRVDEVTG
ncbi:deoxyhypusine hydroxylase nero [Oratosquilla oratoria]|uniref:deoxyhypusine hydroxylase nero n=1 Tax=Oratosquilla oratoria TaxID=337810 RepID=UPI003F77747B